MKKRNDLKELRFDKSLQTNLCVLENIFEQIRVLRICFVHSNDDKKFKEMVKLELLPHKIHFENSYLKIAPWTEKKALLYFSMNANQV